ncbi:AAA family ATPase [Shewanella sp. VB17]|uniref:ATP-binding protein n=1 Tax=Shewanella sp. VB17 TaxID=2739432 RepID=UPI001563620E|nr:AAA family ATPase [Shewanella sp. VB17]NRD75673.1 AAA family ATPase [Shewanella sp. VB17]
MTFNDLTLLPSQNNLLQRLQHASFYGEQLLFLTGQNGSGKTTLITFLINELEAFSSALVLCPKHCNNSEIRRKILVQLLTEPVFDDEISLAETLLKFADSLPQSCFIVLDDVHHLSIELIAECIVMSQLSIPGKLISVTLTTTADYFHYIFDQLTHLQKEKLLPIHVDALTNQEKETLYYTLLSRSDQIPFTPKEIVKNQLEQLPGTPQEVVNLIELSLHGKVEKPNQRLKYRLVFTVMLALFILSAGYALLPHEVVKHYQAKPEPLVMAVTTKSSWIADYGDTLLANLSKEKPALSVVVKNNADEFMHVKTVPLNVTKTKIVQLEHHLKTSKPAITDDLLSNKAEKIEVVEILDTIKPITLQPAVKVKPEVIQSAPTGFTLQLASVRERESLNVILERLKAEPDIIVTRNGKLWIVFLGEYSDVNLARTKSQQIVDKYQFTRPWIRQWKDLAAYQRQDGFSARDIP